MFTSTIPSTEIINKAEAATQKKDSFNKQEFAFINTESNRDNYLCEIIKRRTEGKTKIKLTHYSGSFDYAAFQAIWHFEESETKLANRLFQTLSNVLEEIREQYNRGMNHPTTLVPIIREAIKPLNQQHQYHKRILALDEGDLQKGEADWKKTLYGDRYPEYQEESKQQMFNGNKDEGKVFRTKYVGRNKKIIEEI